MLRSRDLNEEITKIELVAEKGDHKSVNRGIAKGVALVLKMLRDIKQNQVTALKGAGIELVKPTRRDDGKSEKVVEEKKTTVD